MVRAHHMHSGARIVYDCAGPRENIRLTLWNATALKVSLIKSEESGAEEGTRTPTPLRVHGPEPCASANSATSALNEAPDKDRRLRREILIYFKGFGEGVKSGGDRVIR